MEMELIAQEEFMNMTRSEVPEIESWVVSNLQGR